MNSTQTLTLPDGRKALQKTNHAAPTGFFEAEAAGLSALAESNFRLPEVIDVTDRSIVMEYIESGRPDAAAWEAAGEALARLHRHSRDEFGFHCDTYCGDSHQDNRKQRDGYLFYREQRYGPQIRRARDAGLVDRREVTQLERIAERLRDWVPEQEPALLHGDLWSGNLMFDERKRPVLIDPACYQGWPEADLAMTHAFGGFDKRFYQAYESVRPLPAGFSERVDLYNLYHWLNHLNLFGGMYHGQVAAVMRQFGGEL